MWIRCAVVLSLCVFGFGCEKKADSSASGDSASKNGGQITITEGGQTQPGKATVEDADEGQKAGIVSTPGDDPKKDKPADKK